MVGHYDGRSLKIFCREDPLKRLIAEEIPPFEIVGVVNHVKNYGLEGSEPVGPQFYYYLDQIPAKYIYMLAGLMTLSVRTANDPQSLSSSVRNAVFAVNPNQPVFDIQTMDQRMASSLPRQFSMLLLSIFRARFARSCWNLRVFLFSVAAFTRNRNSHGVRSRKRGCLKNGGGTGNAVSGFWCGSGADPGISALPFFGQHGFWSERIGSGHFWWSHLFTFRSRIAGNLHSGKARNQN